MKIRITKTPIPQMAHGGPFGYNPYSGSPGYSNPFGNINSQTITDEENINASVKPVDKEDANLEAEKGEILLKFDLGGIFDIKGKRHSQGGTPLTADPGDFIISRDKSLAITKEEKEVFEFKLGGSYKKSKSTPADVLKKEVDLKHYNQLITILKDPLSDNVAKKTAELMLGKYQEKIGQVAYLQEAKKGFPNGLPDFSMGTAPVKNEDGSKAETKEQMYAQKGGQYKNTFSKDQVTKMIANGEWNNPQVLQSYGDSFRQFGYQNSPTDIGSIQKFIVNRFPELVQDSFKNKGMPNTNKGVKTYGDIAGNQLNNEQSLNAYNDDLWGVRKVDLDYKDFLNKESADAWANTQDRNFPISTGENVYTDDTNPENYQYKIPRIPWTLPYNIVGDDYRNFREKPVPLMNYIPGQQNQINPSNIINNETIPQVPGSKPTITPNNVDDFKANSINPTAGGNPYNPIEWNAQERLTTAMPFLSALATPVQNPMLQQIYTPDIRLDRISNEQELRDIRQQAALTQRELGQNTTGKNAYLASAPVRAQMIDQIGRSNAQNNNVNTQISNSEDMNNYQQAINDRNFNTQAIGQYYDKTQLVRGRRNQELRNALAQSLNNGIQVQDKLDALNQNLFQTNAASLDAQGNPRFILDPKTRTPKLNPNWKGNILNNAFLGDAQTKDQTQALYKIYMDALQSGDQVKARNAAAGLNILTKAAQRK